MVAVSGGAGSLNIKGSIDTSNIQKGFGRIKSGFDSVKGVSKGFGADLQRMSMVVGRLAKGFALLALAGASSMIAIAKGAPAVAPALARMGVAFGKIQRSLGEALAPAFEKVAGWMEKIVFWVDNNQEKIAGVADWFLSIADAITTGFMEAYAGFKTAWEWINNNVKDISASIGLSWDLGTIGGWLLKHFGPEAVAGFLMYKATGSPIAAAVTVAAVAATRRIENEELIQEELGYERNGQVLQSTEGFSLLRGFGNLFKIFTGGNDRMLQILGSPDDYAGGY